MYDIPQTLTNMPRLFYLLRGVRRLQGRSMTQPIRAPITIFYLRRIIRFLSESTYPIYDQRMLTSAVTLAFFGLLRSAEYTCPSSHRYNPMSTLMFRNVSLSLTGLVAVINIKCSKTDPFSTGSVVRVGSTSNDLCPVAALRRYARVHLDMFGPLFIFHNGNYLTRQHIHNLLHLSLPDVPNISTHSFRIGGATAAASAGISNSSIQTLGRWSSDAYRRYLRFSDESVHDFCQRMSNVVHFSRAWDSNGCVSFSYL